MSFNRYQNKSEFPITYMDLMLTDKAILEIERMILEDEDLAGFLSDAVNSYVEEKGSLARVGDILANYPLGEVLESMKRISEMDFSSPVPVVPKIVDLPQIEKEPEVTIVKKKNIPKTGNVSNMLAKMKQMRAN